MSIEKNINIVLVFKEGAMLTGLVTAVGWVGDKAFGESLSPNPSKSLSNFVKMGVNITGRQQVDNFAKLSGTIGAGGFLTALVAGGGWMTEKAFKSSFSEDPSNSVTNFIKMTTNISLCRLVFYYAIK